MSSVICNAVAYIIPRPLSLNQVHAKHAITSSTKTNGNSRFILGFVFATCIPYAANSIKKGHIGMWKRLEWAKLLSTKQAKYPQV